MIFFYYEKNTGRFTSATNIKAISEFSGIPYYKIYGWFNNGSTGPALHNDNDVMCARSELVRGKQRFSGRDKDDNTKKEQDDKPQPVPDRPEVKNKNQVYRNVPDQFDDFFKEAQ